MYSIMILTSQPPHYKCSFVLFELTGVNVFVCGVELGGVSGWCVLKVTM